MEDKGAHLLELRVLGKTEAVMVVEVVMAVEAVMVMEVMEAGGGDGGGGGDGDGGDCSSGMVVVAMSHSVLKVSAVQCSVLML